MEYKNVQVIKDGKGILTYAIAEYGLLPVACVSFCILIGGSIGGLLGVKMWIKN